MSKPHETDAPVAASKSPVPDPAVKPAKPGAVSINADACCLPSSLSVKVGEVVTFTNNDTVPHAVAFDGKALPRGIQASEEIAPGATWQRAFSAPGTFTYHCGATPAVAAVAAVAATPTTKATPATPAKKSTPTHTGTITVS